MDEDQIDAIMKAFRKLDGDGSGSLSVADLASNLKTSKKAKKLALAVEVTDGASEPNRTVGEGFIPPTPPQSPMPVDTIIETDLEAGKKEEAPPAEDVIRDAEQALAE